MKYLSVLLLLCFSTACYAQQPQRGDPNAEIPLGKEKVDLNKVYESVEVAPIYGTAYGGWNKYVTDNTKYPANGNGVQGRVFVSFIVERDGSLTNGKVLRSLSKECDAEALRLVKDSPKWKPAIKGGVPVRCLLTMPINFVPPTQ